MQEGFPRFLRALTRAHYEDALIAFQRALPDRPPWQRQVYMMVIGKGFTERFLTEDEARDDLRAGRGSRPT